jgi:hypothetical protein
MSTSCTQIKTFNVRGKEISAGDVVGYRMYFSVMYRPLSEVIHSKITRKFWYAGNDPTDPSITEEQWNEIESVFHGFPFLKRPVYWIVDRLEARSKKTVDRWVRRFVKKGKDPHSIWERPVTADEHAQSS